MSRISALRALSTNPVDLLESPPPPAMATTSLQPIVALPRSSPSPSPPNLGRKSSLIDLRDWVVDDGPFSPLKSSSLNDKTPTQRRLANKRQSRDDSTTTTAMTRTVGTGVPLIDLSSPPKPKPKPKPKPANLSVAPTAKGATTAAAVAASANGKGPPKLPPRKSSQTSLRSAPAAEVNHLKLNFLYPPRRQDSLNVDQGLEPHSRSSSHGPSSSISSFHSVSLSSDTDTSTPSGSVSNFIATFPIERERSGSSVDADSVSLSESYEEVSASTLASPATVERIEWQYATRKPPKLPDRPSPTVKASPVPPIRVTVNTAGSVPSSPIIRPSLSRHSSISTLNSTVPPYSPYTPRRAAPPPPPSRSSDRSSILSSASYSSHSSHSLSYQPPPPPVPGTAPIITLKTKRPTPVPLTARKRYETVFIKNVLQRNKMQLAKENGNMLRPPEVSRNRRAAGWRGLSVDLITGDDGIPATNGEQQEERENPKVDETVGNNEKLEGAIVKLIWKKSSLDSSRLIEIW